MAKNNLESFGNSIKLTLRSILKKNSNFLIFLLFPTFLYLTNSLKFGTFNASQWKGISKQREIERIRTEFFTIDGDSSGFIDSTEWLNYNLSNQENRGSLLSQSKENPFYFRIYGDGAVLSNRGIFTRYSLIDRGNDGTLDRKLLYFASPRFGQGGGNVEAPVTDRDRKIYAEWCDSN
jgi:hypothetical protein